MTLLDTLIPSPRLIEVDEVDLATPAAEVWKRVRFEALPQSPVVRALFAVRTLAERGGSPDVEPGVVRLDQLVSTPERPGFRILAEQPSEEVAVGAVGKVWQPKIPFVHLDSAEDFAAFQEPGYVKVAWSLRVEPRGERDSRLTLELRVDATDETSWKHFRRYFLVIGPASRFIRRWLMSQLEREMGAPDAVENERPLPGDELLPDAQAQLTDRIDIDAPPDAIWPWLVQMGGRRAGFYSIDVLDNAGVRSAREIHPELQHLVVGEVIPATPEGDDGFEVVRLESPRLMALGGLFDVDAGAQRRFSDPRPERYWHVTWTFVLEPLSASTTRVHVRARAAFPPRQRLHAAWIRPVHHLMERAQLRHLKARVERAQGRDDVRDVAQGLGGAALMTIALLSPFLRGRRNRWGVDADTADRTLPGDELVRDPRWSWTHGVEIEAPASTVWPWVAQIGADRGGFYSYQWLENLVGCEVRNAESVHPEWHVHEGDGLLLHPQMPPLQVVRVEPGRCFVAHAPADEQARSSGRPWAEASWLFLVEPLGPDRCRFLSRYRAACSDDWVRRLSYGPTLMEPLGFAMDRRMLLGVKERAERGGAG